MGHVQLLRAGEASLDIAGLPCDNGADIDYEASLDIAGLPLDNGADIDYCDEISKTVTLLIMVCEFNGNVTVTLFAATSIGHFEGHFIVNAGAELNMTDCDGKTAFHLSDSEGHDNVDGEGEGRTVVSVAAAEVSASVCFGLDEQHRNNAGWGHVHYAAFEGHSIIVKLLGDGVNSVDGGSRSALLSVYWQGHLHIADRLWTTGAEVNQQCCQGASPLAVSAQEGHMGVRKLLLQHGADPTLQDHHGRDPYRVALEISRNDFPPLYTGHIKWFDKNQSQGVIEYQDQGVMNYCHINSDEVERDVSSDVLVVCQITDNPCQITDNPKYGKTATNVFVSAKGMKRHENKSDSQVDYLNTVGEESVEEEETSVLEDPPYAECTGTGTKSNTAPNGEEKDYMLLDWAQNPKP